MLTNLMVIGGLLMVAPQDTTIRVESETRLSVENREGNIVIRTWDRNEVRVETDRFDENRMEITRSGSTLRIRPARPWDDDVDIELTVPAEMALEVRGSPSADISIEGSRAMVAAETVEGDVWVRGGSTVAVRTVEGDVQIEDVNGPVAASSGDGEIRVLSVRGSVAVDGIDGDITLEDITSDNVDVTTVDGDIIFSGPIQDGGRYRLSTHDGDLVATVQEGANVTVAVATFDGSFRPSFEVPIRGNIRNRFQITLGSGSARLELEAFDGEIFLIRPGERLPDMD